MVYKFFEKKIGSRVKGNEKLAEELHKPIIEKIVKGRIVYVRLIFGQQI